MEQPERLSEAEMPQIVNISKADVDQVQAELVRAHQSTIKHVEAEEVDLQVSAAGTISAGKVQTRRAIIGVVQGQTASLDETSFAAGVRTGAAIINGKAAIVTAETLQAESLSAAVAAGAEIHAANIRAGILLSRQVNGNVETTMNRDQALAAGIVGGLVAGLVLLAGRALFGRRRK
jgi:hypothetical protein